MEMNKHQFQFISNPTDTQFDERYNWCLENLGLATDYPPRWQPGELGYPLRFRFRDSKDEFLFKLRWGT